MTAAEVSTTRTALSDQPAEPWLELTPLRMALAYLVFGFLALYLSDVVLVRHLSEPLLSQVQALKGGAEVVVTGLFVFALTRRSQRQLRRANGELARRRDELQLLHRVLRHNLRNDLNVVHGYVDLVRENLQAGSDRSRCERVLSTVREMEQYVEQAQRIRQVTATAADRRTLDLAEAVPRLAGDHPLAADADVTVSVPGEAEVEVNPVFEEALAELVRNAVRHSDADTPAVDIEVDPDRGPEGTTEVTVADDGPGIPDTEVAALREGEEAPLVHLSGVGLWFVDWVVEHSGGDLEIADARGGGAAVRVYLPDADGAVGR
ncbi:MAG: sensor histidine kinase [Halobacteriaceae archaeon]